MVLSVRHVYAFTHLCFVPGHPFFFFCHWPSNSLSVKQKVNSSFPDMLWGWHEVRCGLASSPDVGSSLSLRASLQPLKRPTSLTSESAGKQDTRQMSCGRTFSHSPVDHLICLHLKELFFDNTIFCVILRKPLIAFNIHWLRRSSNPFQSLLIQWFWIIGKA